MSTLIYNIIFSLLCLLRHDVFGDIVIYDRENRSLEYMIDYKITYTPAIPDDGLYGLLVAASPPEACGPIKGPPNNITNYFVLAYRTSSFHSRCSNREKIQNAASAGYAAIILYNPLDSYQTSVAYLPFEHSNISIPAVLVSHEDGELLRRRYLYDSGYKLCITSDMPQNFSYYLIPFAIVIGAGILIIISYLIFQLMMCIMERRKAQRHRLSKKYLKKLTLQKFEKGIYYETCAICLDDYIEGEKIRILPCNHAYHMKCIDPWLTKNRRVCPVCKAKVTLPGMEEYSDSDSDGEHRRLTTSEPSNSGVNETTRLLPSSSSRNNSRVLRNFDLLNSILSNEGNGPRSSQPNQNQNIQTATQSSTQRYDVLDDTLFQPGPSTSAPIISELGSSRDQSRRNRRKKKRSSARSNIQVIVADVTPLLAPAQLSINCDSESDRPNSPTNNNNKNSNVSQITSSHNPPQSSSSRRSNRGVSIDQIV